MLDAFSRRVVGWQLGETLEAELALGALRQALELRRPAAGLLHHSDQGVQYASRAYVELLEQHGAVISMSRRGNPYDNAKAESFIKTSKSEEVELRRYRGLERRAGVDRRVSRRGLQPPAAAFGPGLSAAGGVRGAVAQNTDGVAESEL